MSRHEKPALYIKFFSFIFIFLILFIVIQNILTPKWYYPNETAEQVTRAVTGIYEEKANSIDAVFLGTSHVVLGVMPTQIYENTGITSYNFATSGQPMMASYYMLKEVLSVQKPKVVVLDASRLFQHEDDSVTYRYIFDNIPFSKNKLDFALDYEKASFISDHKDSLLSILLPFFRYHSRINELTENDYSDVFRNRSYFLKGAYYSTIVMPARNSPQQMLDDIDNYYISLEERRRAAKVIEMDSEAARYLLKIKKLCDDNNIEFLLIKVPTHTNISDYSGAWDLKKHVITKDFSDKNGIRFLDLQYDTDLKFDWSTDTCDAGLHLSILGAQKVTAFLADYLRDTYKLKDHRQDSIGNQWNENMVLVNKALKVAKLQSSVDLVKYLDTLSKDHKYTVLMAANSEMTSGLTNDERKGFALLGLQTDFSKSFQNSYIAVIEDGKVIYEKSSPYKISAIGSLKSGATYDILSSNAVAGSASSIMVDDTEYAINYRGINIVVYDNESKMVIDSVCFDTFSEGAATRINNYNAAYQDWLIRN